MRPGDHERRHGIPWLSTRVTGVHAPVPSSGVKTCVIRRTERQSEADEAVVVIRQAMEDVEHPR
jgi:hypothetical protein